MFISRFLKCPKVNTFLTSLVNILGYLKSSLLVLPCKTKAHSVSRVLQRCKEDLFLSPLVEVEGFTPLVLNYLVGRNKFKIWENLRVSWKTKDTLECPEAYKSGCDIYIGQFTNGSSVFSFLTPVFPVLSDLLVAGTIHDHLRSVIGCPRRVADHAFLGTLRYLKYSPWRSAVLFWFLRAFGWAKGRPDK